MYSFNPGTNGTNETTHILVANDEDKNKTEYWWEKLIPAGW